MSTNLRVYHAAQIAIIGLLVAAVLLRFLVRAPEGTSAFEVYDRVELTGCAREVVLQTVRMVRAAADAEAVSDEATRVALLAGANRTIDAAGEVSESIAAVESEWVQVKEAVPLMSESSDLLQMTIDRVLAPESTSEDADADPTLGNSPQEAAGYLSQRADQLEDKSRRLSGRMKQAIAQGVFAKGSLFGFTIPDILLIALALTSLISLAVMYRTMRMLRTPLAQLEKSEIELIGRSDRRQAIRRCHQRVQQLLELAGALCRGDATT